MIVFRIILLIVSETTAAARILVLLLGKGAASLLTALIGLIALRFGVVYPTTLLGALLLPLGLDHWRYSLFWGNHDINPAGIGTFPNYEGQGSIWKDRTKKAELCCRSHPAPRTTSTTRSVRITRVTEPAMSMILTSFGMHRGLRWNQVKGQFAEWRQRARSRNELQFLSDQTLRDIGVSRCDVHREVTKPFWMS